MFDSIQFIVGVRKTIGDPQTQKDVLERLKELVYFIFYFEFEFRTSHTIKRDINDVLG